MTDYLALKWGTLKACNLESEAALAAAKRYAELGMDARGAMLQHDTKDHKLALMDLINAVDASGGEIRNEWTGERMTRIEARAYVWEYPVINAPAAAD